MLCRRILFAFLMTFGGAVFAEVKTVAGIKWESGSPERIMALAKKEQKQVLLFWSTDWCSWCQKFAVDVLSKREVQEKMASYITVAIDGDSDVAWYARYPVAVYPTVTILLPDGKVRLQVNPPMNPVAFSQLIDKAMPGDITLDSIRKALSSKDRLNKRQVAWILSQKWDESDPKPFKTVQERCDFFNRVLTEARTLGDAILITQAFFAALGLAEAAGLPLPENEKQIFVGLLLESVRIDSYIKGLGQNIVVYLKDAPKRLGLDEKQSNRLYSELQAALFAKQDRYSALERVSLWKVLLGHFPGFASNHRQAILELINEVNSKANNKPEVLLVNSTVSLALEAGTQEQPAFFDSAKVLAEKAYHSGTDKAEYAARLGDCYHAMNQKEMAATWYKKAIEDEDGFYGLQMRMRSLLTYLLENKMTEPAQWKTFIQMFKDRLPQTPDEHMKISVNRMLRLVYKADPVYKVPALFLESLADRKDIFARKLFSAIQTRSELQ